MDIIPLPAFNDNYIWLLRKGSHAAVVDPGDATPVRAYLERENLQLCAILVTHHHHDHAGGIESLLARARVPVYGPRHEDIAGVSERVGEGDLLTLVELDARFRVLDIPAHTAGHVGYVSEGGDRQLLFCGDTLFSAGCGRLFEGQPADLAKALDKLARLADDTLVYCAHEYTLANLDFAAVVEPDNPVRDRHREHCRALRAADLPTLPTTIGMEKAINPFLRCSEAQIHQRLAELRDLHPADTVECLGALRAWKDVF